MPSPWGKLSGLVQNVISSLQAIMQQTKPDTHMEAHTIKLNKTQLACSNPRQLVLLQDKHFYSMPLPAVFRSFLWCLYAFLFTFGLLHLEHLRDSNSSFLLKQTFLWEKRGSRWLGWGSFTVCWHCSEHPFQTAEHMRQAQKRWPWIACL